MNDKNIREIIRTETRQKRDNLPDQVRRKRSQIIANCVIDWIQESENTVDGRLLNVVMVYLSMQSEVATDDLIISLFSEDKQVIAPIIDTKNIQLIPKQIQNVEDDLIQHPYGMMQPKETCATASTDGLDLIIVPGIAFDSNGFRLGYGKGFYDRFLPKCQDTITIGLAFEIQIVKDTYPQKWDIPLQHIFTENGIL